MPELPEVETVRRSLEQLYLKRRIQDVKVLLPRMILSPLDSFITLIKNTTFIAFRRKGKYLFLDLDNGYTIVSHLRMEGKYVKRNLKEQISNHTRVIFYLDNDELMCYDDSRSFGIMILVKTSESDKIKEIKKLGPEPFDISSANYLLDKYKNKNLEIKLCLLDQEIMSGLGNIYCDEVLYKSKINPYKKAKDITFLEAQAILDNSIETLNHAITLGGSTVSSYHPEKGVDGKFQNELLVYGKKGCRCVNCNSLIRKDRLGGRGTSYCPTCQNVSISIGITGKIASGKSTVLKYLKELGFPTFSCDEEVTRLYKLIPVKKRLIEIFGEGVLNDNLTVSKEYIKNAILDSSDKKIELENFIHPLVKESIQKFIKDNKNSKYTIVEVPLMFEKRIYTLFDYVLGVTCSHSCQIDHLKTRNSKSINHDLMIGQSNTFDKNVGKCHFLINNDGSINDLFNQVNEILYQCK
ncbi:MAG: DNA-formamidopyrimidine glycosylase [Bacillales bacterium]|nr:DNA-formamidopyrimidine glycosylase [Bacillales bacterium]